MWIQPLGDSLYEANGQIHKRKLHGCLYSGCVTLCLPLFLKFAHHICPLFFLKKQVLNNVNLVCKKKTYSASLYLYLLIICKFLLTLV
jgi:hypothetical protein